MINRHKEIGIDLAVCSHNKGRQLNKKPKLEHYWVVINH